MKWKLSTSELLWWGAQFAVLGYLITLVTIGAVFGDSAVNAIPVAWKLLLFAPPIITAAWSRTLPETFERIEDDE